MRPRSRERWRIARGWRPDATAEPRMVCGWAGRATGCGRGARNGGWSGVRGRGPYRSIKRRSWLRGGFRNQARLTTRRP